MEKIPFDPSELKVVRESQDFMGNPIPIYDFPVSMKEGYIRMVNKEPVWFPLGLETGLFCPAVIPDNHARAFVFEANMVPPSEDYVKDMFGIEWKYVPAVGGSMERPDVPHPMDDANDWEKIIKFPDIDSWDWEGSIKANTGNFLQPDICNFGWEINGWWFERLISFMGFEEAVVALIDDDQKDALHALFEATTDLGCRIIDKLVQYENIDGITVHDDWGSQMAPFFSFDTAMEMIVPHMKKLTDHIHSKGLIADLHSCGANHKRTECFIAAGWDTWTPQAMNDTLAMFDEFGDRIAMGIIPEAFDPATTSEDEQRELAKAFAERVCVPGKTGFFSLYGAQFLTPAFREELYKQSRILYSK